MSNTWKLDHETYGPTKYRIWNDDASGHNIKWVVGNVEIGDNGATYWADIFGDSVVM